MKQSTYVTTFLRFFKADEIEKQTNRERGTLQQASYGLKEESKMSASRFLLPIDQSHRYGRHQEACREPAGSYDKTTRTAIGFEHKTQYLSIRAPYTRIVVFWHISNMISQSQISCNTPTLYIAAIFVRYCYTTDSWLLQLMS